MLMSLWPVCMCMRRAAWKELWVFLVMAQHPFSMLKVETVRYILMVAEMEYQLVSLSCREPQCSSSCVQPQDNLLDRNPTQQQWHITKGVAKIEFESAQILFASNH
eukprot:6483236-Amphidinium_carterae.1